MRALSKFAFLFTIAFVMVIAFSSEKTAFAQTEDDVVINEFTVNPNVGKEYVELLVTNASGVNMQGWTISDVGSRAGAASSTEGDIILPSAAYLSNVPQGTHVVIVGSQGGPTNILAEDTSTADSNNRLVLIVGTTTGLTTTGTASGGGGIDLSTNENIELYAGSRASGTMIDQVVAGSGAAVSGAAWTTNIPSTPSNSVSRFVPTANTLAGFQANDTGAAGAGQVWFVDTNSYGTPGYRNAGVASETAVGGTNANPLRAADFDGDKKADVSVWDSSSSNWYYIKSTDSTLAPPFFWGSGALGDIPVPGDYDGDGKTDIAVWRPSEGNWYIANSGGTFTTKNWGASSDTPVPADYDGDGKTDIAVYRPSEGNWYIINSLTNTVTTRAWGASTDKPAPADYDGDGKADITVYRPSEGNWYTINSYNGSIATSVRGWGTGSDVLVPGDYDGDFITDLAVFRPSEGNWYIRRSTGTALVRGWGTSGDKPVPGDYDGDGKTDIAVYRPSEGNWYIIKSSDSSVVLQNLSGDKPVPNAYLPQ